MADGWAEIFATTKRLATKMAPRRRRSEFVVRDVGNMASVATPHIRPVMGTREAVTDFQDWIRVGRSFIRVLQSVAVTFLVARPCGPGRFQSFSVLAPLLTPSWAGPHLRPQRTVKRLARPGGLGKRRWRHLRINQAQTQQSRKVVFFCPGANSGEILRRPHGGSRCRTTAPDDTTPVLAPGRFWWWPFGNELRPEITGPPRPQPL